MKETINALITTKKNLTETDTIPKNMILDEYICQEMYKIESCVKDFPNKESSWDSLDEYFYEVVKRG